jgi:hypothetical protein
VDVKFDTAAQPGTQDATERLFKAKTEADNAATRRAMMEMLARLASQL